MEAELERWGLQVSGQVDIDAQSGDTIVGLEGIDGKDPFSQRPCACDR